MDVPKWIERQQTKRKKCLSFENHKKWNKPKKYVDLPSDKICMYCGKIGYYITQCQLRIGMIGKNVKISNIEMGC